MIFGIPPPINGRGGGGLEDIFPAIVIALVLIGMFLGMIEVVEWIVGPPFP